MRQQKPFDPFPGISNQWARTFLFNQKIKSAKEVACTQATALATTTGTPRIHIHWVVKLGFSVMSLLGIFLGLLRWFSNGG